jgi:hypothetical protein
MTSDFDGRWEDAVREQYIELSDKLCQFRFELLESLRCMPVEQRRRLAPAGAEFLSLLDGTDRAAFRKMLKAWMADDASEFRRTTLDRLGCDPEAWKHWSEK